MGVLQFNSIQHYLPRDSIRFYRLRSQCSKTVSPTHFYFRCQLQAQGSPVLLTNQLQIEVSHDFLHACMLSHFSRVRLFANPWTGAHQAPLSMGFSRQEYWSGLPCPLPGNLPNPGIKPSSPEVPALQADSLPLSPQGRPTSSLCLISLPEKLTEFTVTFNLLDYRFIIKGYKSGTARQKRCIRQSLQQGNRVSLLLGHTTLLEISCVHQPGSSLNSHLFGFLRRLHYIGTIKYLVIGDQFNLQCLSSPQKSGSGTKSFNLLNALLVALATSPYSQTWSKCHLLNITKNTSIFLFIGNSKNFRSSMPETMDEDQLYISQYKSLYYSDIPRRCLATI